MISARNALSRLENALAKLRRDEGSIATVLRNLTDEAARLRLERVDSYKALAEVRIDSIRDGELVGHIDSAEQAALSILDRRASRLGELAKQRERVRKELDRAEKDRLKKVDQVKKALKQIDDLDARIEKQLQSDSDWIAQKQVLSKAVEIAKAADQKATGWENDLEEKGIPYREDPLFMYLWSNGYGTSRYNGGALTRFFDRWIANLVEFETARRDYHTLNEMPLRLREHADHVGAAADEESLRLSQIERRALETAGVQALEAELEAAHHAVEKAEALIAELNAKLTQLDAEQKGLVDETADADYQRAVSIVAENLEREDLRVLFEEARATRSREDDNIIRKIELTNEKIANTENRIEEARGTALDLSRSRAELERSRDRFYRSGYDDPLGGFSNGDVIGEVIGGILSGMARGGQLDDLFDRGFRPGRGPRRGNFGGGIQFPSGPVRGPWTGGGSYGGRRSSRGGFKTGGGF